MGIMASQSTGNATLYSTVYHTWAGMDAESTELDNSIRVGSNGPFSYVSSNQELWNPYCQLEKSNWEINAFAAKTYHILADNQHSISIFHHLHA